MNTLVTGFLSGKKLNENLEKYLDSINSIINTNINIVLFVDSKTKEHFKESSNLKIYSYEYIEEFPYKELVENLRTSSLFLESAPWVKDSSQAKYSSHNPIIMSKPYMLKKAVELNPFNSEKFIWYDAGILKNRTQFGMQNLSFKSEELTYIFELFTPDEMYFMATLLKPPYKEIHGFKSEGIKEILGELPGHCCRAGNFGGGKDRILDFVQAYDSLLKETLEKGYMGTEETIFTLLNHQQPELYKTWILKDYNQIYKSIYNQKFPE